MDNERDLHAEKVVSFRSGRQKLIEQIRESERIIERSQRLLQEIDDLLAKSGPKPQVASIRPVLADVPEHLTAIRVDSTCARPSWRMAPVPTPTQQPREGPEPQTDRRLRIHPFGAGPLRAAISSRLPPDMTSITGGCRAGFA